MHDSARATVEPGREAGRLEPRRERRRARVAAHRQERWVCAGAAGGLNSHVSGMPRLPSAPSDWPLSVKSVAPDEPVRTSTEVCPVNVRTWPSR